MSELVPAAKQSLRASELGQEFKQKDVRPPDPNTTAMAETALLEKAIERCH